MCRESGQKVTNFWHISLLRPQWRSRNADTCVHIYWTTKWRKVTPFYYLCLCFSRLKREKPVQRNWLKKTVIVLRNKKCGRLWEIMKNCNIKNIKKQRNIKEKRSCGSLEKLSCKNFQSVICLYIDKIYHKMIAIFPDEAKSIWFNFRFQHSKVNISLNVPKKGSFLNRNSHNY